MFAAWSNKSQVPKRSELQRFVVFEVEYAAFIESFKRTILIYDLYGLDIGA